MPPVLSPAGGTPFFVDADVPEPALIVTYLLDRYVPSGMAMIEFGDLARLEEQGKDWTLDLVDGSLRVRLIEHA